MPTLVRVVLGSIIAATLSWVGYTAYELSKHQDGVKEEDKDDASSDS